MAMDFFEHQEAARRRTGLLVFLFVLAVVLIVVTICTVVGFAISATNNADGNVRVDPIANFVNTVEQNWLVFLAVSGLTVTVIFLASLYKVSQLSSGGQVVAEMMNGRLVQPGSGDVAERRLLNVVQEMAIASGIAVPPVYVMDNEEGINAFAAGFEPDSAVVAVTRGALNLLDRDELQGVIGHEFSHILNGDMRLNIRLIGLIHGILVIALVGYYVLRSLGHIRLSSSRNKEGGGTAAIMLALLASSLTLIAIGYIGVFIGNIIKGAVSRQREYLADASSVQFTRNPRGLAEALAKIGGLKKKARIDDPHAQEISHMFFANALHGKLFATHPPLASRIVRIMPEFDGTFEEVPSSVAPPTEAAPVAAAVSAAASTQSPAVATAPPQVDPARVVATIGAPGDEHLLYAAALVKLIPDPLQGAAIESYGARAIVYALLLDSEEQVRKAQLARLRGYAENMSYRQTLELAKVVKAIPDAARVPLAELCLPALRSLSVHQYDAFRANLQALVEADRQVDQSEYVLWTMIVRHLDQHFGKRKAPRVRFRTLTAVAVPTQIMLSTLARVGQHDKGEIEAALKAGMNELGRASQLLPEEACSLDRFDQAMQKLAGTTPGVKKRIVRAAVACVLADGKATTREFEMLRAVSASLDCPMPPLMVSLPKS